MVAVSQVLHYVGYLISQQVNNKHCFILPLFITLLFWEHVKT